MSENWRIVVHPVALSRALRIGLYGALARWFTRHHGLMYERLLPSSLEASVSRSNP